MKNSCVDFFVNCKQNNEINYLIVSEKYRVYASISFAILLFAIGVPLWWHTTAVPRVAVPYSGITALSNLNIKIRSRIIIGSTSRTRAQQLTDYIAKAFENSSKEHHITTIIINK